MIDDLTRPLGLPAPPKQRRRLPLLAILAPPAALAVAVALLFVARLGEADNPAVVAPISGVDPAATGSIARPSPAPVPLRPGEPGLTEVTPSGGLVEVGRGEVVVRDPNAPPPIRLAAAPREDLVETTAYGAIPKIGTGGARPIDVYARPADAADGMFRVAIVVGGIGLSEGGDGTSLEGLPGAVTLGIAPYGGNLAAVLADARAGGHEVLLQIPLEPYNYPDVDPGPKTLTTAASAEENLDRLHWLMSRLTTYVGVVNYMGARFTGEADKLAPVLAEIGKRGLLYLDDGSSARSQAPDAAAGIVPFLRADVVLDADTDPAAIDKRLDQLAAIARERGSAIATGSAFPATVERIAAFARGAQKRGIVIVPITALLPPRT